MNAWMCVMEGEKFGDGEKGGMLIPTCTSPRKERIERESQKQLF